MEIRVGKYTIYSDQWNFWIMEEYQSKGKDGKPGRTQKRKVAGYADDIDTLIRQFVAHKHMASEATTVEALIKEFKQIADDTVALKKAAVANDLKLMRKTGKEVKDINK